MMPFSTDTKNAMLNSITPDTMKVHTADPGPNGTTGDIGTPQACSFNASTVSERTLAAQVSFTGIDGTVTHHSVWSGATFLYSKALAAGQTLTASDTLNFTTSTKFDLSDI